MFKPHRCLAFERSLADETQQCGSRIEQSAHGRGRKRPHVLLQYLIRVLVTFRKVERGVGQIWQTVQLRKKTCSGLNGPALRCIPAGKHCRTQMRHPFKALLNTPDEKLSTPDGSIVSVASAVQTDAEYSLRPFATLGQNRRYVRPMVLNNNASRNSQAVRVACRGKLRMCIPDEY